MTKQKSPAAVARGRKGGLVRAQRLTLTQRQQGARKAALARWRKVPKAERQELARRAVLVRWKAAKKKAAKP
jgi:hypothetical protein